MDDTGSRFPSDAADSAPLNPARGREQVNYPIPSRKKNPLPASAFRPDDRVVEPDLFRATVIAEAADYLLCIEIDASIESAFRVSKPYDLQRSRWDAQTVAGVSYTYTSPSKRYSRLGFETISPKYVPGVSTIYVLESNNGTGVDEVDYIDLNADGRKWTQLYQLQPFKVITVEDDVLECKLVSPQGVVLGDSVYVEKPHDLKRSTWDGQTINGVDYVWVSNQSRQATDGDETELQVITPSYVEGHTVILVSIAADGSLHIDSNSDGRSWALDEE
jgi:hypothetical protein